MSRKEMMKTIKYYSQEIEKVSDEIKQVQEEWKISATPIFDEREKLLIEKYIELSRLHCNAIKDYLASADLP